MHQYLSIAKEICREGTRKPNRTGIDTVSLFAPQFVHDMDHGFPLLTTKEVNFHAVLVELLWFLRGGTDVSFLHEHGVHIWDHWADDDGNVGPIYGKQWRDFVGTVRAGRGKPGPAQGDPVHVDQIKVVLDRLRQNPYDRRLIVSAWNPIEVPDMGLPPCHVLFQLLYDGSRLNLHMYQRSADWMIGVPFNIASYALLLHMLARVTDHVPGKLAISFGDAHIYVNHMDGLNEQLNRTPRKLPTLWLNPRVPDIDAYHPDDIRIMDYRPHPKIKFDVAV